MTKGWTEERRRKQAEIIRRTRPWEKSTGPRTAEGKEKTRMNALKTGSRSAHVELLKEGLRLHILFLKRVDAYFIAENELERILSIKRTEAESRKNKEIQPAD